MYPNKRKYAIYPTPKQILARKPHFRKGVIEITKLWKATSMKNWKNQRKWIKMEKIGMLLEALTILHRKPNPRILLNTVYLYERKAKIIHLDRNNPSIISALHELAHYLFEANEIKACRWSYWIFAECFPESLKKLVWKGHLLIKRENDKV